MNDYAFGNFLYTLRTEKGLSQAQLGEMLGVTNKAVSKWENGSTKPNTALIPRIAEILGITVEELFSCKRFKNDYEYETIKNYLLIQKRKYAILSSIFLSAIITLPLFLMEFIFVIMGFHIPDDILGPLGSVGFIFAFIVSITAYIIYRKNFNQAITPTENVYPTRFINVIKKGLFFSAIICYLMFILLTTIYFLVYYFSSNITSANIFLSIGVFILILFFGTFICFANIKRLLKIKFSQHGKKEKKRIHFSKLPTWAKICYIAVMVLLPIVVCIIYLAFLNNDWLIIKITSIIVLSGFEFPLIIYNIKNK